MRSKYEHIFMFKSKLLGVANLMLIDPSHILTPKIYPEEIPLHS